MQHLAAIDDVDDESDREPRQPGVARRRILHDDHEPREERRRTSDEREHRPVHPADAEVRPRAERELVIHGPSRRSWMTAACATVKDSIAPNEYIVPRKSTFPGSSTRIETKPAKTTSASHGVLNRGCSFRNAPGSCRYDAIEYVIRDAPMMPGVRRDEEDRRREDADVDLEHVEQHALDPEVVDDAEDGVVLVAALLRSQREQRRQLAVRSAPPAAPRGRRAAG